MPGPRPVDDPLITTFGRLLEASATLSHRLGHDLERECGIALTWFEVLLRISRSDGGQVSMGALAQQVALTTGGITRLLDRMIAADLVERVPCPTDRRVYFASLTRQGETTLHSAAGVHARTLHQAFAGFDAQDLDTLDALLDRLRAADLSPRPVDPTARSRVATQT